MRKDELESGLFDPDGFLLRPEAWDAGLARTIARADGIGELTDDHWAVINQMRDFYFKTGGIAPMAHDCHSHHLDEHCVEQLFESAREAWRVAGLPNPGPEAKAYMQ